jgi:uncharacterized membrane protein
MTILEQNQEIINTSVSILGNQGIDLTDANQIKNQTNLLDNIKSKNSEVNYYTKDYNTLAKIYNTQIDIKDKNDFLIQNIENKINKNENELLNIEKKIINKNKLIDINEESLKKKEIQIHCIQIFFLFLFLLIFPVIALMSKSISKITFMSLIFLLIVLYIVYLVWYINRRSVKRFRDQRDTKFNKGVYYVKKKLNELDDNISEYASKILNEDCGCDDTDKPDDDESNDAEYVSTTDGLVQRVNTSLYYDDGTGPKQQIIPVPKAKRGKNFVIDWESGRDYGSSTGKPNQRNKFYYDPDPRWPNTGLPKGSMLVESMSDMCSQNVPPNDFIVEIYSLIMRESIPRDKLEYYQSMRLSKYNDFKTDDDRKNFVTDLFNTQEFKHKFKNPMNWVKVNDKPYVEQNLYQSITTGL